MQNQLGRRVHERKIAVGIHLADRCIACPVRRDEVFHRSRQTDARTFVGIQLQCEVAQIVIHGTEVKVDAEAAVAFCLPTMERMPFRAVLR